MPTGRPSRQGVLALLLLALLVLGGTWLGLGAPQAAKPFDLRSGDRTGLLALKLWLEASGYRVDTTAGNVFKFPAKADLLFIYPNAEPYTDAQADELDRWVEAGGTLVLVGPGDGEVALRKVFGVATDDSPQLADLSLDPRLPLAQQVPLMPQAPATLGHLDAGPKLDLADAPAAVPALATRKGQVTAAAQVRGRGVVWHLSQRHSLTNGDLAGAGATGGTGVGIGTVAVTPSAITMDATPNVDAIRVTPSVGTGAIRVTPSAGAGATAVTPGPDSYLLPALLRRVPAGGNVVFDTYHLFGPPSGTGATPTLGNWLNHSGPGRALLWVAFLLFLGRLWGGLRLGPPLVVPTAQRPREAAEYVTAMANLYRRAHQQPAVAQHHRQRLKRALGRALQVNPDLPDGAFLARLQAVDPRFGQERAVAVGRLLAELAGQPTEARLVELVAEVDRLAPPARVNGAS